MRTFYPHSALLAGLAVLSTFLAFTVWRTYSAPQAPLLARMKAELRTRYSTVPDTRLNYRHFLETHYAGHGHVLGSSPTSTFSNMYVLTLQGQEDRQIQMGKIARALGFEFEFFYGTSKNLPMISWIAERVKEMRDRKRPVIAKARGKKWSQIGGSGIDSDWLLDSGEITDLVLPDPTQDDHRWQIAGRSYNWTTFAALVPKEHLTPRDPKLDIPNYLYDPLAKENHRKHSTGAMASWHSHVSMWRLMVQRGEKTALFLEDDVDLKWDFERLWVNAERFLPGDWDMVAAGHCWAHTNRSKQLCPLIRCSS